MRLLGPSGAWLAGVCAVVAACGTSDDASDGFDGTGQDPVPHEPGAGGGFAGPGDFDAGGSPPPEVEVKEDFERPQAGEHFVYAANPASDTIAVIDAATLAIQTVEAGDRPTFVQTVPGTDTALVINAGSSDATIVRASASGTVVTTVPVVFAANAISVDAGGAHAVVYYDPTLAKPGDPVGTFQDVTVVRLDASGDTAVDMTVGFRPSAVTFSADGAKAFVVTEDGISVLDLADIDAGSSGIARTISLGDAGRERALDVSVTKDGRYALARQPETSVLRLVDLESGSIRRLDLSDAVSTGGDASDAGVPAGETDAGTGLDGGADGGGDGQALPGAGGSASEPPPAAGLEVTDLDLSSDGAFALAVVRNHGLLVKLPLPGAFDDPRQAESFAIPDEVIGLADLLGDGHTVLAYTTAFDSVERISIVDLSGGEATRAVQLRKAVRSVLVSPDGATVLVRHARVQGDPGEPGIDLDVQIDRSFGYSLLDIESGFSKLQVTASDPDRFAAVPDGSAVFLLFDDPSLRRVERAELRRFQIDQFELGSRPVSIGVVAQSQKVFVSQEHPDGRLAFIDWVTGDVRSVTGFELNSRIRE